VILLQGCWLPILPANPAPPPAEPEEIPEPVAPEPAEPPRPGQFRLRYDRETFTMNPITARNRDNIVISSLLYESLFILDENLRPVPMLCAHWESEDNVTFTFTILPNIIMHDGSILNADDVSYSIRQAMRTGRHQSKLRSISSVNSDGELTVTIVLNSPNARINRVLDIPIIKSGSIEQRIPPGTGPYIFPSPEAMRLTRFVNHRHFNDMPLTVINLIECYDSDLTEFFDDGRLSLIWDDPTSAFDIRLNRRHETRHFNTTALHYIGFNANSRVLRNQDVRRAIGNSIERQLIVDNIMNVPRPGQTVAAPVAISPIFDLYDHEWEHRLMDPLIEMTYLLERAGLEDYDNDSFLEMNDGYGNFFKFTLDFIVNIENSHKFAAANRIADNLRQFGFNISVRGLPWGDFIDALEDGDFDMFYGETMLGADFDLSPLLLPGDGSLNYGRTANTAYRPLIESFLAAETPEDISYAGSQLNLAITQMAPFIPILYKRYAIYSPMGVITGASPGQSGVFHNFQDWSINLYNLN